MHDAEIEIEFVFRRLAAVKPHRDRAVEFVFKLLESIEDLSEEVVSGEGLQRIERPGWIGGHGPLTETSRIKIRCADCFNSTSPMCWETGMKNYGVLQTVRFEGPLVEHIRSRVIHPAATGNRRTAWQPW